MLKSIITWALAALFTANSIAISLRTNYNAGTLIMWGCSAALVVYGLFHRSIDSFTATPVGRVIKAVFIGGVCLYAALFLFVAVSGYSGRAKGDEKALIVLGAGLRGESVGDLLRRRLVAAYDAWQENPEALLVVTGGQGPGEDIPEAVAMQRWLVEKGVPEACILVEDKSTSTEENLRFAQALLAEKGIGADAPVAVVTNAFHCYRAGRYAEKLGFTSVRTLPASMNLTTLLPSYLREVLAILYMWVFRRQMA
ncbi:YdcF family protein [Ruminococcaceae bacterium OttesenSCG-928-O06]|nr:YdcF family protein [Ruminococcaceae bacterium OttesenSCG-928-O06]